MLSNVTCSSSRVDWGMEIERTTKGLHPARLLLPFARRFFTELRLLRDLFQYFEIGQHADGFAIGIEVEPRGIQAVAETPGEDDGVRRRSLPDGDLGGEPVVIGRDRQRALPCATVRAISDTANDDLPLDFNQLVDERQRLSALRLAGAILRRPWAIPGLMRLGRHSGLAARNLADALGRITAAALANP